VGHVQLHHRSTVTDIAHAALDDCTVPNRRRLTRWVVLAGGDAEVLLPHFLGRRTLLVWIGMCLILRRIREEAVIRKRAVGF